MTRPEIVHPIPAHLPEIRALFAMCNSYYGDNWSFNPDRSLVALHDGKVVGFVTSWWDGQPIAWVDLLLVAPAYRNQGVAIWLCATMEAILLEDGAKAIRCVLDNDELFAKPLEKAGFMRTGTYTLLEKHYEG